MPKKSFTQAVGNLLSWGISLTLDRSRRARLAEERLEIATRRARLLDAQTLLTLERVKQVPEQTEGIVRRYLRTTEGMENDIIRQRKQELEIAKLKLQIKQLELELGIIRDADQFNPINYEPK